MDHHDGAAAFGHRRGLQVDQARGQFGPAQLDPVFRHLDVLPQHLSCQVRQPAVLARQTRKRLPGQLALRRTKKVLRRPVYLDNAPLGVDRQDRVRQAAPDQLEIGGFAGHFAISHGMPN